MVLPNIDLNTKKAFVTGVAATAALVAAFVTTSREPESIKWIPYTTAAVAGNKSDGKSSAVLFGLNRRSAGQHASVGSL